MSNTYDTWPFHLLCSCSRYLWNMMTTCWHRHPSAPTHSPILLQHKCHLHCWRWCFSWVHKAYLDWLSFCAAMSNFAPLYSILYPPTSNCQTSSPSHIQQTDSENYFLNSQCRWQHTVSLKRAREKRGGGCVEDGWLKCDVGQETGPKGFLS